MAQHIIRGGGGRQITLLPLMNYSINSDKNVTGSLQRKKIKYARMELRMRHTHFESNYRNMSTDLAALVFS